MGEIIARNTLSWLKLLIKLSLLNLVGRLYYYIRDARSHKHQNLMWCSHCFDCEVYCLLECDVMKFGTYGQMRQGREITLKMGTGHFFDTSLFIYQSKRRLNAVFLPEWYGCIWSPYVSNCIRLHSDSSCRRSTVQLIFRCYKK